ncbi:MAG: MBL fold metallo-hydrolase [Chitinophagia bacterium]|nr:MBL fold metallo-hydrolase [Chitinophagia bacterium]
MLNVVFFTFNTFEENTYVIYNEHNDCWLVDPGMYSEAEKEGMFKYLTEKGLNPKAIINTHAHIDHIMGIGALQRKYKIPFYLHEAEQSVLDMAPVSASMFGLDFLDTLVPDSYISEHEKLTLGHDEVEVRFVPGHSPGSICFYYAPGNWVISGDALFAGSIGRTDLPGGNHSTLVHSIKTQLLTLPNETRVLSGHGRPTTIGAEKTNNPYIK